MEYFQDLKISDSDFQQMVTFIQENYGIDLSKKRQLVVSRLSHSLKTRGYANFRQFLDQLLSKKDPDDLRLVLDKLTTNYTYFMRESEQFDFLQQTILPDLIARHQRDRVLSIWSAGCSSGEEPYTISMALKAFLGSQFSSWDTRILATDISNQAMAKAKAARYKKPSDVPSDWFRQFFRPIPGSNDEYTLVPEIRNNVIFRPFNLMSPIQFRLKFDIIFCRNVMIYFNQATRDALVRRFYNAMHPSSYLFISRSESLGQNPLFRMLSPAIYQRVP